ncbi:TRAP transporter small permease [Billgrantia diversa]|uniref:TRAP transporter small permease n=1 Tax=Halomonas sp. MCCC 1A13316 TaxID=2733487 RepID=UPI0018A469F1|nr:TRAP transporter small permease [Halomonas sp. MCCC 1A13316]QOR39007.1 TRAP transporter small permease [Halomonas sp. MCCC 1A13316]
MVSWFLRFEHCLTRLAMAIAILMLIVSVTLGFYQVLTRFIFNAPSTWSEVLSRATMIWCVFLGAAATFRGGYMMAVELIYKLVPRRMMLGLELVIGLCCLLVLGVLFYQGILMTDRVSRQTLSALEVSISWAYAAIPVGSAIAMVAVVGRLLAQATAREGLGPQHDEAAEPEAQTDPDRAISAQRADAVTSTLRGAAPGEADADVHHHTQGGPRP